MTDQQQDLADELKRRSNARDASWEESNHPRDQSGQFGSGGEGGDKPKKRVGPYSVQRRNEIDDALKAVEAASKVGKDDEDDLAMDPPVSEQQAKAMHAAAEGRSTLGIPKKVGQEFVGKDANGNLTVEKRGDQFYVMKNGVAAREQPFPTLPSALYWISKQNDRAHDAKPVGRWGGRAHKGA